MTPKLSCCHLLLMTGCVVFTVTLLEIYISFYIGKEERAKIFRAQFVLVAELLMLVGSRYIYVQIFKKPLLSRHSLLEDGRGYDHKEEIDNAYSVLLESHGRYVLWKWSVITFCVLSHLAYIISYFLVSTNPYPFAMLCWISLGLFLHLIAALLGLSILYFILHHLISVSSNIYRKFVAPLKNPRVKASISIAAAFTIGMFSFVNTLYPPQISYVTVPLKNLPASLDKFVIIQVSDIHLGPTVGADKLRVVVDSINRVTPSPRLIVITGDLVDSSVEKLGAAAAPLRDLAPGVSKLFVTGNHEYYTGDIDHWFSFLQSRLGIKVLHNSNVKVGDGGDYVCVAGTDDIQADKIGYAGHGMDLGKAVDGCRPEGSNMPLILLAHQPNAARRALEENQDINLVLSGHTHGGQMYPIAVGAYILNAFYAGLYKYRENTYVYVSKGTYYYGIPMKMFNSLEITHITLTRDNR